MNVGCFFYLCWPSHLNLGVDWTDLQLFENLFARSYGNGLEDSHRVSRVYSSLYCKKRGGSRVLMWEWKNHLMNWVWKGCEVPNPPGKKWEWKKSVCGVVGSPPVLVAWLYIRSKRNKNTSKVNLIPNGSVRVISFQANDHTKGSRVASVYRWSNS